MAERMTHAGGIVYRIQRGRPVFLLVTARRSPSDWIFPKGRIEAGETAAQAAVREVHEEAGVDAEIVVRLDDVRLRIRGQDQRIRYFLMRADRGGTPGEGRRSAWLDGSRALTRLPVGKARASLRKAISVLAQKN